MSNEDRDDIIAEIRVLRRLIGRASTIFGVTFVGVLVIAISDHFEQVQLRDDVKTMKPRVDRLWYRAFPTAGPHDDGVAQAGQ